MLKKFIVNIITTIYFSLGDKIRKIIPKNLKEQTKLIIKKSIRKDVSNRRKKHVSKSKYEKGINLVGFIRAEIGLGHGCRLLARAIEYSDIKFNCINYEKVKDIRFTDNSFSGKIKTVVDYNVTIIHINPDVLDFACMFLPRQIWKTDYIIGFWLWELPVLPENWVLDLALFDEIWAPSNFIVETIKKATNKPVTLIPYGIELSGSLKYSREHFKLPKDTFLYLTMYDINSVSQRKNPMGAINAFIKTFETEDIDVGIVVKINNLSEQSRNEFYMLKDMLEKYKNVFFITEILNKEEVNSLINCVDVFISLHRSEGFGLVPAEAMYLGKPVVATNWSSTTDFMNCQNSCPVDYILVELQENYGPYEKGQYWAEPNIKRASDFLLKLYKDKIFYNTISDNACKYIRENYSISKSAESVKKRLLELELI